MIGMTVCSGIGAPEVAAPWIDWRYQSEIEPFPAAVLAARFPDATNLGDMTQFQEWPDVTIDLLCGGTPCQSFSVAGLRKGLADPRGNLTLTYLAIAAKYRPRWLVWENVPGVLSALSHPAPDPCPPDIDLDGDDGPRDGEEVVVTDEYRSVESHALWCFMAGAAQLGYHGGFCHLDVQYVQTPSFERAIPQRRERVFFVGHLGDWRRAAAVLFDGRSLSGHPPPRREARQIAAPSLASRTRGGGEFGTDTELAGGLIPSHDAAQPLLAKGNSSHRLDAESVVVSHDPACTLTARERKGAPPEADLSTVIAHALRGKGFDASEDGTGRGTPIIAFHGTQDPNVSGDVAHPVGRNQGQETCFAIQERAVAENPQSGPQGAGFRDDGAAYTIEARNKVQAVAFDLRGREGGAMPEGPHETANLRAASGGSSRSYAATDWAVRRLTPTECERLMGFPDGWTAIPWRGKPPERCPDGPRYKALGNSWGVNCGEYIFDRLRAVDAMEAAA